MAGALTFFAGKGVSPAFLNLSKLRPLNEPHANVDCKSSRVGMLIMNSPDSSISLCECLWGETLMATKGGEVEVGIIHAMAIMFGLLPVPTHETSTVCMG